MKKITRRNFTKIIGATGTASLVGMPSLVFGASKKVVVVGGGFGGATAAKYLRKLDSSIEVTLVEPNPTYYTCPFSNTVLGGIKNMSEIAHGYGAMNLYQTGFTSNGITTKQSVNGLLSRIDSLTLKNSGTFWHSNGEILPW